MVALPIEIQLEATSLDCNQIGVHEFQKIYCWDAVRPDTAAPPISLLSPTITLHRAHNFEKLGRNY